MNLLKKGAIRSRAVVMGQAMRKPGRAGTMFVEKLASLAREPQRSFAR